MAFEYVKFVARGVCLGPAGLRAFFKDPCACDLRVIFFPSHFPTVCPCPALAWKEQKKICLGVDSFLILCNDQQDRDFS